MWCRNIRPHRCLTYLQRCAHNSSIREQQLLNLCLKRVHLQTSAWTKNTCEQDGSKTPSYVCLFPFLITSSLFGWFSGCFGFRNCLIFSSLSDSPSLEHNLSIWSVLWLRRVSVAHPLWSTHWLNTTPLLSVYYVTQRIKDLSSTATPSN